MEACGQPSSAERLFYTPIMPFLYLFYPRSVLGRTHFVNKMMEFAIHNQAISKPQLFEKKNLDYIDVLDDLLRLLFENQRRRSLYLREWQKEFYL